MSKNSKVTMQRIADLTGVSKATVSNALNGRSDMLSQELLQKILQTAAALGYRKRNHLIRFIIFESRDGLKTHRIDDNKNFQEIYRAIKEECSLRHYRVQINHIRHQEKEQGFQYIHDLADCDGMIILGWELSLADLEWLRCFTTLPFVIVDASFSSPEYDFVTGNNADASYKLTEAIINAGHKRIGYIYGGGIDVYRERLNGYRNALYAHGLEYDRSIICTVDRTAKSVFVDEIKEFLIRVNKRTGPAPTAFVISDDRIAVSFLAAAKAVNWSYAIAGFDNLPLCLEQMPPLASAEPNYRYNGTTAASRMIDKIERNDCHTQKIYTEITVYLRESIYPKHK